MEKFNRETDSNQIIRKELVAKLTNELPVLRARIGVSQKELAEKIGLSRQTLNYIETGKKEMPWVTFLALIAIFQNNEETKKMLSNVEGLEEELSMLSDKNNFEVLR